MLLMFILKLEVKYMQKLFVHNGKVWEKAELHLKSAVPGFNRTNIAKVVALDLLKEQVL